MRKKTIIAVILLLSFILIGWNFTQKMNRVESTVNRIPSGKDITFFIATDTHYISKKINDGGKAFKAFVDSGDGKQLYYIDEITESLIYDIGRKKPDVLIISGDLTSNGEKDGHLDIAKKLKRVEEMGTSVYVIPGNHDILNPWARGFKEGNQYVVESIDQKEFSNIYSEFGYGEAISKDQETLSYLAAPSEDIWLLMLDTNNYKNNIELGYPQTDGQLNQGTIDWIKECYEKAKKAGATILPVMHHNLLNHSTVIHKGFTLNNNEEAIQLFQSYGTKFVLSGHIHVQDISSYQNGGHTIYDIVTGSLAVNPHQYGVLNYSAKDHSFDYQTSKVDVEGWSKAEGIQDQNLNYFSDYAEEFFGQFATNRIYSQLLPYEQFSDSELKEMAEVKRILNIRYFAGQENLNTEELFSSKGYQLWFQKNNPSLQRYVESISTDNDTDDNHLQIK